MRFVRLLPVLFAGLFFAAHLLRFYGVFAAILAFLFIFTLAIGKQWILRVWQLYLAAATVIWIQTTIEFVRYRMAMGIPWTLLLIIMGFIILLTVFSVFWLENKNIKRYFTSVTKARSE